MLRRTGFPEAAEEALRGLPDPVEGDQIAAFLARDEHQAGPAYPADRFCGVQRRAQP